MMSILFVVPGNPGKEFREGFDCCKAFALSSSSSSNWLVLGAGGGGEPGENRETGKLPDSDLVLFLKLWEVGLVNNLTFLGVYLDKEALKFSLLEHLFNSIGTKF